MGSETISADLLRYASEVPEHEAIVEVGCWLGAGTQYLAKAGRELHVYDRWQASEQEVEKAARFGLTLKVGQDTLPLVKERLAGREVRWHKGRLADATYDGPTIGLYVDDASKRNLAHSLRIFGDAFRPGTILMLMDYHYPKCHEVQKAVMRRYEFIESLADTSTAVFRWV